MDEDDELHREFSGPLVKVNDGATIKRCTRKIEVEQDENEQKQQLELNFMCWNLLAPPYNRGEETSQWLERIRNQIKQVSQKSPDIIGLQVFICTYITFVFSFIVFLGLPEI